MEPSTRTLAPITSTNEAKASMSTASSTASRTSDSPSKSPLWRLPPDVLTNLQPSYWTRRSSHGPPDGGPAGAVPPAGFVLGLEIIPIVHRNYDGWTIRWSLPARRPTWDHEFESDFLQQPVGLSKNPEAI